MPRIKINLPVKYFNIEINIPVRITDINYGDHVGNDSLVAIIHEARMQFLQHYGYTELN
ncbi:MAG: esterase, partial [Chitinophagaceae bacterium]|nr:esterase [Chitinophagaceae bacterium]